MPVEVGNPILYSSEIEKRTMYPGSHSENMLAIRDIAPVHRPYPAPHSRVAVMGQPHAQPPVQPHMPLQAHLALKFGEDGGVTRLVEHGHFGPLLVQRVRKPLYPEAGEVCHVAITHPPGGVVGGDELEISAGVGASARAEITTSGAAKWTKASGRYKVNGRLKAGGHISRQTIRLDVDAGGALEWVPQEAIFFDNVHAELDHSVTLGKDASYIGCEILCFGRTASGKPFHNGQIRQRIRIQREEKLIWLEQLRLPGGSSAMGGSLVPTGRTVCATLIATGGAAPGVLIDTAQEEACEIADDTGHVAVYQLESVVVARYLGNSSETAKRVMSHVRDLLRPVILGRPVIAPRMWST